MQGMPKLNAPEVPIYVGHEILELWQPLRFERV